MNTTNKRRSSIHLRTKSEQLPITNEQIQKELEKYKQDELAVDNQSKHFKGGYRFPPDDPNVKLQRSVTWEIIKEIGSKLLEGLDLINFTLPVCLFEPRSYLQRLDNHWMNIRYLNEAAKTQDPLQRFLKVIAQAVGSLHNMCVILKPFNPILGETYQAVYPDGSELYCEQTSHHPPISHWYLKGNGFVCYGFASPSASIRGNALKAHQKGPQIVEFDDGTKIEWEDPPVWLSGMMWGDRVVDYYGKMTFVDHKNGLKCKLLFNPYKTGLLKSLFVKKKAGSRSDDLKGDVIGADDKVLGIIEGSWLQSITFKDKSTGKKQLLWDYEDRKNDVKAKPIDNPLPSDSRYREDIIWLAKENLQEAANWKDRLERKQRYEAKLRKEGPKK